MAITRIDHLQVNRLDVQETVVSGGTTFVDLANAATDEKTKVSSNDTTPGFLNGKLVAGANVTLTENNDGGNETLTISAAGGGGGELGIGSLVQSSTLLPATPVYNAIFNNTSKFIYLAGQQRVYFKPNNLGYNYSTAFNTGLSQPNQYRFVFNNGNKTLVGDYDSPFFYSTTNGINWTDFLLENVANDTFRFRNAQYYFKDLITNAIYFFSACTGQYVFRMLDGVGSRSALPLPTQFIIPQESTIVANNNVVSITMRDLVTETYYRLYSTDFVNWLPITAPAAMLSSSALYGEGFKPVAGSNAVWLRMNATTNYVSLDSGITYSAYTFPVASTSNSQLIYNNGRYIYKPDRANTVYTSTDLSSWTTVATGGSSAVATLIAISSTELFLLVTSDSTQLMRSTDNGSTWTAITANFPASKQIFLHKINSTYYIVLRDSNTGLAARMMMYSSTDLTNWTLIFSTHTTHGTTISDVDKSTVSLAVANKFYNWCSEVVNGNVVVATGKSMQYYNGTAWTQHYEYLPCNVGLSGMSGWFYKIA
jgi:hypothetical protein